MSAQGSPTSTDGAGEMSGTQIAFRMVQATEAAAAAANAASAAISSMTAGGTQAGSTVGTPKSEWYKVLPKPGFFEPKDREAELASFRDWWWQVEQYILAVDANYGMTCRPSGRSWMRRSRCLSRMQSRHGAVHFCTVCWPLC